jgi:hypothetical protein
MSRHEVADAVDHPLNLCRNEAVDSPSARAVPAALGKR